MNRRREQWQHQDARCENLRKVLEAISITLELVQNARSDNLAFKD